MATDPTLSLLDRIEERHVKDEAALRFIAQAVIYKDGFLHAFVPNQRVAKGEPFLVTRGCLAALLILCKFDQWQMQSYLELQDDEAKADVLLHLDEGINIQRQLSEPRWLRMVDLALQDLGICKMGPYSTQYLDAQVIRMNAMLVAEFLRSARYVSWNEGAWTANDDIRNAQKLLAAVD